MSSGGKKNVIVIFMSLSRSLDLRSRIFMVVTTDDIFGAHFFPSTYFFKHNTQIFPNYERLIQWKNFIQSNNYGLDNINSLIIEST